MFTEYHLVSSHYFKHFTYISTFTMCVMSLILLPYPYHLNKIEVKEIT